MVTCSAPGRCLHTLQGDKQKVLWELMQSAAKPIVGSEEKKNNGKSFFSSMSISEKKM